MPPQSFWPLDTQLLCEQPAGLESQVLLCAEPSWEGLEHADLSGAHRQTDDQQACLRGFLQLVSCIVLPLLPFFFWSAWLYLNNSASCNALITDQQVEWGMFPL